MNKRLIIFSLSLSLMFSYILFTNYKFNKKEYTYEKIYLLQIGAYKDIDNVRKINNNIILKDDKYYYAIVGISKNKQNLNKIKALYKEKGNNLYIKEKIISNISFINDLNYIDEVMLKTKEEKSIIYIQKEALKKYQEAFGDIID